MFSNTATDLAFWEYADGAAVEFLPAVMEEIRRLAVDGFVAFGHGGLEIGGVLYGLRDGGRLSVHASAELPCEHALGPGFTLSENDRQALARLLEPPPGLQTLGWYRSHTRKGLELDANDRELFERIPADGRTLGLVLKPSRWGPSAAAFYAREISGAILPAAPREFAIEPMQRRPQEPAVCAETPTVPAAVTDTHTDTHWDGELQILSPPPRHGRRYILAGAAVLAVAGLAGWLWPRAPRSLSLQAYAVAPGQLRIDWNHRSRAALDGVSGILEIRDGDAGTVIPLDAHQLRVSSMTYTQKGDRISVKLRVNGRRGDAPLEESIEFSGPAAPPAPAPAPALAAEIPAKAPASAPVKVAIAPPPAVPAPPKRKFQALFPAASAPPAADAVLPAVPLAPAAASLQSALPDLFPRASAPPKPAPQAYNGPKSGRLIWTGDLGRRGVVEIEGARPSIGSLSGSLAGVPADYRVSPAEFTRDGLAVYTADATAQGRTESPSKANGWNSMHFQVDAARSAELVVLESPNRVNGFNRLVLRNDARTCPVIVVDWTVHSDVRN